ncbi:hypothetical protein [Limnoglobus roseus]|uniref:Uncharacterized protein n=1 Tax=Limnoglobus roseus TaxID=2598579 RepID=A0A5C1A9M5_9BACT|nr:hypothetical protein [Limnoglobus roseus]QEL14927.1 hypothetical protein PX52LOC_01828 [Limnoglobus roseus]
MDRPRQSWSRLTTRHLLPALLVLAQVMTAVGFPTFSKPSARKTACGDTNCGCQAKAGSASAACCCSTAAKLITVGEPESCCAKPKKTAESCCSKKTAAKPCCEAKKKPEDDRPQVLWVAGMFARSCKGEHGPTGMPVPEPAVPPLQPAAPAFVEPASDAVLASNVKSPSLPAIPPDPPPRHVG